MVTINPNVDDILARLKVEFVADALDRVEDLEQLLERCTKGDCSALEVLAEMRRQAHSIKGMGGSFGYPAISAIGHRLEDYLSGLNELSERNISDCYHFFDVLREILKSGEDPGKEVSDIVLQKLPAKWIPALGDAPGNVEILVAISSRVLKSSVERELHNLGYRFFNAQSGFDVLQLSLTMRPHAVILSAVLPNIWGLDVARALGHMDVTKNLPVGVVTSFSDEKIGPMPPSTVIIRETMDSLDEGLAKIAAGIKVDSPSGIR